MHGTNRWKKYSRPYPVQSFPEVDDLNVAAADENGKLQTAVSGKEHPRMLPQKLAQPTVFIPVFPGTNCEYDSTKAFERAGAKVITQVFKNLTAEDIRDSVDLRKSHQPGTDHHVPGRILRR